MLSHLYNGEDSVRPSKLTLKGLTFLTAVELAVKTWLFLLCVCSLETANKDSDCCILLLVSLKQDARERNVRAFAPLISHDDCLSVAIWLLI